MHLNFGKFSVKGLKVIAVQSEIIMTGQCKSKWYQAGKQLHVLIQTLFLGLSKSLTWKKTTDEWALSVNGVRRTELSGRTVPVVLKHTLWHLNNDTHIKAQSIFTSISSPPVKKERIAFERLLLVWSTQTHNGTLRKKRLFIKSLWKFVWNTSIWEFPRYSMNTKIR